MAGPQAWTKALQAAGNWQRIDFRCQSLNRMTPKRRCPLAKPQIDQLLIDSALQPSLCRQLLESPEEAFKQYELTEEEVEILRHPDHRLLPLLGKALSRQAQSACAAAEPTAVATTPPTVVQARALPDTLMALTVVPCALREEGQLKGFTYAVWVKPLPEGVDPASLPLPADAVFPGQPLIPLHAVIQISAVQSQDAAGNPQIGLWACMRQSTNVMDPPPLESAGGIKPPACQRHADPAQIQAATAAVRSAPQQERYARLADLLHALQLGDAR